MTSLVPIKQDSKRLFQDDATTYLERYQRSIEDPEGFYSEQANALLSWQKPFTKVLQGSMEDGSVSWFEDGILNVSENCIDVHLAERSDHTALIWESNDGHQTKRLTYAQLHEEVCRFANVLKKHGCAKGDRVCLYMPMILEGTIAMLACARIGAIHSCVFAGFSPDSIRQRIEDAQCEYVITADAAVRGASVTNLKYNVDKAIEDLDFIAKVIVVRHTEKDVTWTIGRDCWWDEERETVSATCLPEPMDAEDPLFILYTSGSTGQPKGVLHSSAGYLLHAKLTFQHLFGANQDETYWCTADLGWITGHSYIVYGPLASGSTSFMFEGIPNWPTPSRCWQIIDKHDISVFYTAPTAIRALMAQGDQWLTSTHRNSLRLLGTVGEAINPEAWRWFYEKVGQSKCSVVDTWWQTETGGVMMTPIPGVHDMKPGAACRPFYGIKAVILDDEGTEIQGEGSGSLAIAQPWPSQIRSVYGNKARMLDTYFKQFPGYYLTGDGARRDADGDFWLTGRTDDVINVSGHRLGTAEIESALVLHPAVAEAAVVGFPHEIKGEGIFAFVTVIQGHEYSDELKAELIAWVSQTISPIAKPQSLAWAPNLPKTRSGKIMRRILRLMAAGEREEFGDISTLNDTSVIKELLSNI